VSTLKTLNAALELLDYANQPGLQGVSGDDTKQTRQFVWRDMHRKCGVTSAHFRNGVPVVAFVEAETPDEVAEIRLRLWNLNRVPLLIATTPEEIIAHSCFESPSLKRGVNSHKPLLSCPWSRVSDFSQQFNRLEVERGRVADRYKGHFRQSGRVENRLITNLRVLRKGFDADHDEMLILDRVIGRVIFIRYLEDRRILPRSRLREVTDKNTLIEVLRSGTAVTYKLFTDLADKFNGDIFSFPDFEEKRVKNTHLAAIGDFFAGDDLVSGQQSLWPYDFSILPSDLISSVYEQLLEESQRGDGAYYTPRRVVDLILDETLPLVGGLHRTSAQGTTRILDPACGSGVFLTEAFRRMIYKQLTMTGESLDFDSLAHLLTRSIFGVDKSEIAVGVTALSLYLALLEEVDSKTIWASASLPRIVGKNLVVSDFFENHLLNDEVFDIVVGNPPWISELSEPAMEYLSADSIEVPDQQMALAFLHAAANFLAPNGVLGFLLPSKALLHNRSKRAIAFRRLVFERFHVETVVDLSAIRRDLFRSAVAPAAVLIAKPRSDAIGGNDAEILHVAPRSSPLQLSIDGFVVSDADVQSVSAGLPQERHDLWKTLLWGSMADHALLTRLRQNFQTLSELATERSWTWGRGVQVGDGRYQAGFLVGMPYLEATAIEPFHLNLEGKTKVQKETMSRPRRRELFEGPHILIRRGLVDGRPAAAFSDSDFVHNDSVIGISGPRDDADRLRLVTAFLNSSLALYYQFLTSSSWGVERSYVELNEHLSLPVPNPPEEIFHSIIKEAERASKQAQAGETEWRNALDDIVFDAYQLTDVERRQVIDQLSINLDLHSRGIRSSAFDSPKQEHIDLYSQVFEEFLQETLLSTLVRVDVTPVNACYAVVTVDFDQNPYNRNRNKPLLSRLVAAVEHEASRWPSPTIVIQPSEIVFVDTVAHLIKWRETRHWSATQAYEDASNLLGAAVLLS